VFGLLFAFQWLSEIVPSLVSGTIPKSVTEIGAPVNPVHVLDLAFVLPGMIVTAVAVRNRSSLGLLFAAPLLTFSAAMGIAILSMFLSEQLRGVPVSIVPVMFIGVVVLMSVYGGYAFVKAVKD
jgi:hypothetical protein